jgi:lipid-binding SYLF domain-containing protein
VPKDAFKGAKGVVFLQAAAAAVGLTAFRGQGFIVAKVDGAWSAPAFIRLSTLGMGFSLGGALQHFFLTPGETHPIALPSSTLWMLHMAKGTV